MPEEIATAQEATEIVGQEPETVTEPAVESDDEQDSTSEKQFSAEYVRQLRDEAANTRKKLREAEQALKAIDDEKLSETERLQNRVTELEAETDKATALAAELERSNKALSAHVETLRNGVPDDVLVLLDGKSLPEQLEWLSANRDKYIARDPEKTTKGIPGTPKANANGIPEDEKRKRAAPTWRG